MTTIGTIHLIDDSDDEVFLTEMLFEMERVDVRLRHLHSLRSLDELDRDEEPFDPATSIIVVDLNLRSSQGTDVLALIRSAPGGSEVIAGIATGSQDPADRRDAFAAGADFCIAKPLDLKALAAICDTVDRLSLSAEQDAPVTISVVG